MAYAAESLAREEFSIPPGPVTWADNLVTEDDTPVDNIFSEKQQRLLTETLYASWRPGKPFAAMANVGLFSDIKKQPIVPDVLLSMDVKLPKDVWKKHCRAYFIREYGKPPEITIEIVSNKKGDEDEPDGKLETYAEIGIRYYVVYDPECQLSKTTPLRVFKLVDADYVETVQRWLPEIGIGLTLWKGVYEEYNTTWLRWCGRDKRLIPTGVERSEKAEQGTEEQHQRAEEEHQRAEEERQRAETAEQGTEEQRQRAETAEQGIEEQRQRAERLAAQLRALGIVVK
ncbi:MAG: Uma2 family endonuclease [Gammaproteobacteria bacterium]|nr:Uma2 family endonuclease [Gammaproteobacteria bacterium]